MVHQHHTRRLDRTEEAIIILFCLIDDAYALLNPHARCYESIKRLSDSEVITLALFQQLRGVESERSFLRDAERFFSHLFPGVVGLALPRCTAASASSGACWSPCVRTWWPSWSAIRRPLSSTRACSRASQAGRPVGGFRRRGLSALGKLQAAALDADGSEKESEVGARQDPPSTGGPGGVHRVAAVVHEHREAGDRFPERAGGRCEPC